MATEELPTLLFEASADLEAWLVRNHVDSAGLWLKIAKKGSGVKSVSYAEALELALCFGWIDSQKRGFDERHFLQRFTPRRSRGKWSLINREKAEGLIAAGAMRPAGLAEVEAAKADGRWDAAYAGSTTEPRGAGPVGRSVRCAYSDSPANAGRAALRPVSARSK